MLGSWDGGYYFDEGSNVVASQKMCAGSKDS